MRIMTALWCVLNGEAFEEMYGHEMGCGTNESEMMGSGSGGGMMGSGGGMMNGNANWDRSYE